ncbi:uncharacterized protein NPIL_22621 [Nephila pilipes]|uniref:Uncharacterized protein n=1 Tax=Nephila pilipes TaxID=299642 RepID=A0A8X6I6P2_NEPPI|nr:uncharacterized protein NPIL_22621 [Nephila pilipes]
MEIAKKNRAQQRRLFTKACNEFDAEEASLETSDKLIKFKIFEEKAILMKNSEENCKHLLFSQNVADAVIDKEIDDSESYIDRWRLLQFQLQQLSLSEREEVSSNCSVSQQNTLLRYPKIQLPTFNGDIRSWVRKMPMKDRENLVEKSGCCFLCLKPGHQVHKCYSKVICLGCGKRHHILLCHNIKQQTVLPIEKESAEIVSLPNRNQALANVSKTPSVMLLTLTILIRVLGLQWSLNSDTLSVNLKGGCEDNGPITKRQILSKVHNIFDPVGYTCPVTLNPKKAIVTKTVANLGFGIATRNFEEVQKVEKSVESP